MKNQLIPRNPDPKSMEALKSWIGGEFMPSRSPIVYSLCETVYQMAVNWTVKSIRPGDSVEMQRLAILWAERFEQANEGVEWGVDKEFFESVDEAFDVEYKAWLATATDTVKK